MPEKKSKHEQGVTAEEPEDYAFVLEPAQIEVGSGYSFSVNYDEDDKPIIDLKTYGNVNMTKIKREIERAFPNAQIRQLKTQSIIVATKPKRKQKTKKKRHPTQNSTQRKEIKS